MQKRQASKEIDTVFVTQTKNVNHRWNTTFQMNSTDMRKSVNKIVISAKCFLNMPATNSIRKRSSMPIHAWQMNWNTFTFDHKKTEKYTLTMTNIINENQIKSNSNEPPAFAIYV